MEKIIDCKGMACPLPVVNAKKAAEGLNSGDVLTVLVDNEIAVQNLTRFAEHKSFAVSAEKKADGNMRSLCAFPARKQKKPRKKLPVSWIPGERECW